MRILCDTRITEKVTHGILYGGGEKLILPYLVQHRGCTPMTKYTIFARRFPMHTSVFYYLFFAARKSRVGTNRVTMRARIVPYVKLLYYVQNTFIQFDLCSVLFWFRFFLFVFFLFFFHSQNKVPSTLRGSEIRVGKG